MNMCWGIFGAAILLACASATCQEPSGSVSGVFQSTSTLVTVPTLVRDSSGEFVGNLAANDFVLYDNGVRQSISLAPADRSPIALVVVLQTGRAAMRHFSDYVDLPAFLEWLPGTTDHEIMLVTFDSRVEINWHFPVRSDGIAYSLTHLHRGDTGAAITDAVQFAVEQLQGEPGSFRRIVLLISQEKDAGSTTSAEQALRTLGKGSTAIYSLTYPEPESKARIRHRRREANGTAPIAAALDELREHTATGLAAYTGGAHVSFSDRREFDDAIKAIADDIHHRYALGFQPTVREPGFHPIQVETRGGLRVTARGGYWFDPIPAEP